MRVPEEKPGTCIRGVILIGVSFLMPSGDGWKEDMWLGIVFLLGKIALKNVNSVVSRCQK